MDTPLEHLAEQFRRLPGIGIKTARKLGLGGEVIAYVW